MQLRWNQARTERQKPKNPLIGDRGWKSRTFLYFRSREKNVLDIPSYRSRVKA